MASLKEGSFHLILDDSSDESDRRNCVRVFLLPVLFFLICFGLGYPTLNRYNPAQVDGTSDSARHYEIITNGPQEFEMAEHVRGRLLVPYLAKPFYYLARNRIRTWDAVFFGLLVVNSFFCAGTAMILVMIGERLTQNPLLALVAGFLYLLNYAVANFQLAGLIDSAEAFFLIAIVWTLMNNQWAWLVLLAFLGAAAKETIVPLAATIAAVWWAVEWKAGSRVTGGLWVAMMVITGLGTVTFLQSLMRGHLVWPWSLASYLGTGSNYFTNLWRCIIAHEIWYTFIWLLPLGLLHLKRLPRAWVFASFAAMLVALALGAYRNTYGSVARPMFNATGPLLSLSVAIFLTNLSTSFGKHKTLRSQARHSE
jgi:hypothetical protein